MKKSLVTSILFLSSGIVFGSAGMYLVHISFSADNATEGTEVRIENSTSRSSTEGDSQLNGESIEQILINKGSVASLDDPSIHTDAFQRRLAIYTYVAGLSVQELTAELEEISSDSKKFSYRVQDELKAALVERLAIVKPETAVKFAVVQKVPELDWSTQWYAWRYSSGGDEPPNMPIVRSVFSDWALSDLKSAIRGAKSLGSDAKSNALAGILATQTGQSLSTHRQIARELGDEERGVDSYVQAFSTGRIENPKAAWDEVRALQEPNNFHRSEPLLNIASQWLEQDGFSVLDEINQSTLELNIKSNLIYQLLSRAAEDNPDQAFQFALRMPGQGGFNMALNAVVNSWSQSDPQTAFQAVTGIEQSGLREQQQRNVARTWSRNEPRYVLDNLDLFPANLQDAVRRDAIAYFAQESPKEAAELALEQLEGTRVDFVASQIMRAWIEQDIEGAINWVYNGPVSEENQYSWISALTSSMVPSDPRRAFDLAISQEIPEGSSYMGVGTYQPPGLEADVIRQIAFRNLDLAVELLPRVRDGITKAMSYASVGDRYIDEGHSSKALELGLKLPSEHQLRYFEDLAHSWARVDPGGLVESIEQLPTEKLRSKIASNLSNRWYRENFTEEQIDTIKQFLSDSDRQALEDQ
ncbi:MAG: hypothetical protein F4X56_05470 [Gammaproteobacteria bacterium]|nr:hypothetical protein [Gammaproteobacteria bacterium]